MHRHRAFGLRSRIFASYSAIVVTLVLGVTLGLTLYVRASLLDREIDTLLRFVQKSAEQVDTNLQSLKETAVQIGLMPEIVDIFALLSRNPEPGTNRFESDFFDAGKKIVRALSGIKYEHFTTGRISLYDRDGSFISYGRLQSSRGTTMKSYETGLVADLWERVGTLGGRPLVLDPHGDFWSEKTPEGLLSVLWNIKDLDYNTSFGLVEVQQSFQETIRLVDPGDLPGTQAILFGQEGKILWESDGSLPSEPVRAIIASSGKKTGSSLQPLRLSASTGAVPAVLVWGPANEGMWTIAYLRTEEQVLHALRNSVTVLVLSGMALMLLSIGAVGLLSVRLSEPLHKLSRHLDKVDWDNLSVELDAGSDADIMVINKAFTQMFERLQASSRLLVQSRVHESKAHLLALQSQMDPHFLFNMLAVLSAEARAVKAGRMVEMCTTLAATLRYVSDYDTSHTTLATEFSHVKSYLELMRFRFEDGLVFDLDVCAHADEIFVPKLILQPLAENCFRHGFADRHPPWVVSLKITADDASWQASLEDNGNGLTDAEREQILGRVAHFLEDPADTIGNLKIGGLGLVNSLVRLKLHYGDAGSFEIGRSALGGTGIILRGPIC